MKILRTIRNIAAIVFLTGAISFGVWYKVTPDWEKPWFKITEHNLGSYFGNNDFMVAVAKGDVAGHSFVHKFGANSSVSTSLVPVASAGFYRTPSTTASLEFVSSDTADALDDEGMHELTVIGLDASWNEQTVTTSAHATDGTTAVNIAGSWLRVYRAYVSESGRYATQDVSSHVGTITIREQGGGDTWANIPISDSFPVGQTLIGAYTVPAGYTAYIMSQHFSSDVSGTKVTSFYFFKRENANDVTSSFTGTMRTQNLTLGTQEPFFKDHKTFEAYPEYTDMGYLAIADASSRASVEFELLLVAN